MNFTHPENTLDGLAAALASRSVTAVELVDDCLARISDPAGQGALTFLSVDVDGARAAAQALDRLRAAGVELSPFAGIPISVKDLFDVRGQVTRAGSKSLSNAPPAKEDADAVKRLRAAGLIVIGRTNMTEFAYSGVGLNPHYGTPKAVWQRNVGRIPGGSSSGAAISVADGMAYGALGTDTGGSCRIPAAFNNLTGFKPSQGRVSTKGAVPLSPSLDCVGHMARSVSCCAALDAILTGSPLLELQGSCNALRLGVPKTVVLDGVEPTVANAFQIACRKLVNAGATISEIAVPEFQEIQSVNALGGFAAAESYAYHRAMLAEGGANYDPRVRIRIEAGARQSAADYIDLLASRRRITTAIEARFRSFDAILYPTTPIVPPRMSDFALDVDFTRLNGLCLRNPSLINFIEGCSLSVPIAADENAPVGLLISGLKHQDDKLFIVAAQIERALM